MGGVSGSGALSTTVAASSFDESSSVRISSMLNMTVPSETPSPTLTRKSLITPSKGAGTSIVALSVSSVMRESSSLTRSPGLTSTSMTGISLKSPMSGTKTSLIVAM